MSAAKKTAYHRRENPLLQLDLRAVPLENFEACLWVNRKKKRSDEQLTVWIPNSDIRARIDGVQQRASARRFFKAFEGYRLQMVDYVVGVQSFALKGTWQQVDETYKWLIEQTANASPETIKQERARLQIALTTPAAFLSCHTLEIDGPSAEDVLRLFDAGFRRAALKAAESRNLPLKRTSCQDVHPLQNLPTEVKAELWRPYVNYDLSAAHLLAAGVPKAQIPNYTSLAKWLSLPREAIKQYANQLIIQREPKGTSPWAREHGYEKQSELARQLGHLRSYAASSADLQRWVRDHISALTGELRSRGYRVLCNEHDGLVVDREIEAGDLKAALSAAGFPEHVEFRKKSFT